MAWEEFAPHEQEAIKEFESSWGAWRTSMEACDTLIIKPMAAIYEHLAQYGGQRDTSSSAHCRAEAARFRNLGLLLAPGDAIWISKEPPDHPEFITGTTYIVVVRSGKLIAKEMLTKG
jgi:hypothetical protein